MSSQSQPRFPERQLDSRTASPPEIRAPQGARKGDEARYSVFQFGLVGDPVRPAA
jgi:hypothetical protein